MLFSEPAMVRDLLTHFVREDWVQALDLDTLERVNQDFTTEDLRERRSDTIWRVRFKDDWLYVLLLLEFQSSNDRFMALRLMSYVALLLTDLFKANQLTTSGRLPPVLPLVLYNGDERWTAPVNVAELIEPVPGRLARYTPRLAYLLIDESSYADTELQEARSFCAALFELERSPTHEQALEALHRAIEWAVATKQHGLVRAFAVFVERLYAGKRRGTPVDPTKFPAPEERYAMLAKNVERWIEEFKAEGEAKGRAEGRAEGEAKGRAAMLVRFLEHKFGPLDPEKLRLVMEADEATLLAWSDRLLEAETVEDVIY
jgi:hypothetical protein